MTPRVSVVIPAYNEEDLIAHTVRAASSIPGVAEVIVVDDGSRDDTKGTAKRAGATCVVELGRNVGKGGALNQALKSCTGEILLLLDGDLGPSAAEGAKLLEAVQNGTADMAIGVPSGAYPKMAEHISTLAPKSGGFGLVVRVARLGIKLLTGRIMNAPLSGQRALKREIVERAGGFESRFGVEVGLTIDAVRMGYKVVEIPINMVHRATGKDVRGFRHRGSQLFDVLKALCKRTLWR